LIAIVLITVSIVRILGVHPSETPTAVIAERDLRFLDRDDGSIAVFDVRAERPIDIVSPGTNGFLRATLRGLARDRRRAGDGPETPFRLAALADGRLMLEDLATGHRVDLEAFGATNAGVFAQLLTSRGELR
jgi:putative photosynthetic complex assembly protein